MRSSNGGGKDISKGQGGGNMAATTNISKIGGDAVTTAVRTIARETQQDKGNAATTTGGYCILRQRRW